MRVLRVVRTIPLPGNSRMAMRKPRGTPTSAERKVPQKETLMVKRTTSKTSAFKVRIRRKAVMRPSKMKFVFPYLDLRFAWCYLVPATPEERDFPTVSCVKNKSQWPRSIRPWLASLSFCHPFQAREALSFLTMPYRPFPMNQRFLEEKVRVVLS